MACMGYRRGATTPRHGHRRLHAKKRPVAALFLPHRASWLYFARAYVGHLRCITGPMASSHVTALLLSVSCWLSKLPAGKWRVRPRYFYVQSSNVLPGRHGKTSLCYVTNSLDLVAWQSHLPGTARTAKSGQNSLSLPAALFSTSLSWLWLEAPEWIFLFMK